MWRNPRDFSPNENFLNQVGRCKIWTGVIQWHHKDFDSTLTKTHIIPCEVFPKSDHYNGSRIWPETGLRLQLQILPQSLIGHWNSIWFKFGLTHSVEFIMRNPFRHHLINTLNQGNVGCLYFTVSFFK